ncbi:MAG: hypothetical protein HKP27_01455 [Myxococcales bacterium]|nr:hypothetical protein [Myxococcales bacterium]
MRTRFDKWKTRVGACPVLIVLAASCIASPGWSQWLETLPPELQKSVLWLGDHEEGDTSDWANPAFQHHGGGIFNTGTATEAEAKASNEQAHSGEYSVKTTIRRAFQSQYGKKAVRLFRWTNRSWDDGGEFFPKEAYYSTWMYFPHTYNPDKSPPWDPGDGGWWNVFQFKSDDANGESQPIWNLHVDYDDEGDFMYFYLRTGANKPAGHYQALPRPIPVGRWFHVEAFYRQSAQPTGEIQIWVDGEPTFSVENVRTILSGQVGWAVGNYTDHITGGPVDGEASIYFDDAVVSTERLSSKRGDLEVSNEIGAPGRPELNPLSTR